MSNNSTSANILKRIEAGTPKKYLYSNIHGSIIHNGLEVEQPKHQSTDRRLRQGVPCTPWQACDTYAAGWASKTSGWETNQSQDKYCTPHFFVVSPAAESTETERECRSQGWEGWGSPCRALDWGDEEFWGQMVMVAAKHSECA